jgi:hypothetical protein
MGLSARSIRDRRETINKRSRNVHRFIIHRLFHATPSQPCTPNVHTLDLHILSQTFQQTLSTQPAALPTTERQVPASCRTRAIHADHAALQLCTHTEGTLEVFGVQAIECQLLHNI